MRPLTNQSITTDKGYNATLVQFWVSLKTRNLLVYTDLKLLEFYKRNSIGRPLDMFKNKGYATDCPTDNLIFFIHQNVREFLNILNNDPNIEM